LIFLDRNIIVEQIVIHKGCQATLVYRSSLLYSMTLSKILSCAKVCSCSYFDYVYMSKYAFIVEYFRRLFFSLCMHLQVYTTYMLYMCLYYSVSTIMHSMLRIDFHQFVLGSIYLAWSIHPSIYLFIYPYIHLFDKNFLLLQCYQFECCKYMHVYVCIIYASILIWIYCQHFSPLSYAWDTHAKICDNQCTAP